MQNRTLEGGLLVAGLGIVAALTAELAILTAASRSTGLALWRAVGVEVVAGREAAIPIALSGGAPRWLVAQVSAAQDIGFFCIAFPLFLRLMQRLGDRRGWLTDRLRRIQDDAERHRGLVHRWGGFGVFLFMLVPFLVNGPLVGGVAGKLAGLRTADVLLPVAASTSIAAVAWTYFYGEVFALAGDLHPLLPFILTAVIVGFVVGSLVLKETLEIRRERMARKS